MLTLLFADGHDYLPIGRSLIQGPVDVHQLVRNGFDVGHDRFGVEVSQRAEPYQTVDLSMTHEDNDSFGTIFTYNPKLFR